MKNNKYYWSCSNYFEFKMPLQCVLDCSGPGPADDSVAYWQPKLNLKLGRAAMIADLKECGAWGLDELNALSNDELEQKIIWLAANNIRDDLVAAD